MLIKTKKNHMAWMALSIIFTILPSAAYDFTLGVFGNANMDDTIDEGDIASVREIIAGTKDVTEFADADNNGI